VADANTAALLLTLHTVDLAAARIATTRAQRREVKLLARRMTTDHTSLSSTLTKLLATLDLKPREDEVSRLLRGQNVARRDTLRSVAVRRFDSTYVANEVRFHQDLLVAIDRVFLPSVGHPELRDYVTAMRPTIAEHLAHAEQVQTSLATRK
jgi:putative membrane protein